MTATVLIPISSSWTQVGTGSAAVSLYLQGSQGVIVNIGTSLPAADSSVGIQLSPLERIANFANLSGTDNVYVRSTGRPGDGPSTASVVVIRSGN